MKRIAIDMDEVIADFHPKMLATLNQHFGGELNPGDLNVFSLQGLQPEKVQQILTLISHPDFFADLAVMADSQRVISALSERYDIFITTAAMEIPSSFNAKFQWLQQHFPAIKPANIVFCGNKGIINADYMIDDNIINFKDFCGEGILYSAPHNRHITGYQRVDNWQDIASLLL